MGLASHWLHIAEAVGVDAFLGIWSILDSAPAADDVGGGLRVYIPRYDLFLRYQRNRYILALKDQNLGAKEIKNRVRADLDVEISERHVTRIIAQKSKS